MFTPRTRRRPAVSPVAAELLEHRRLLAAGGTRVVTAAEDGADVVVSADDCDAVLVTADARLASLTVLGGDGDFQALIRGGAGRVSIVGGDGGERVTLAPGADVGTLRFVGGGGDDVLTVAGAVSGNLSMIGGAGADTLRLTDGATVAGRLAAILGGNGDDADAVRAVGTVTVGGDFLAVTGGGADLVTTESLAVGGDYDLRLGESGEGTDVVRFGGETVAGRSTVFWSGRADLRETAGRAVEGDTIFRGDGDAFSVGRFDRGGTVGEDFLWETRAATNLRLGLTVGGDLNAQAGAGRDFITLRDGTEVGGRVGLTLGGEEADPDTLRISGEVRVGTNGPGGRGNVNFSARFGGGSDYYVSDSLFVAGGQTLIFEEGSGERVRMGAETVTGDSFVQWRDDAFITDFRESVGGDAIFRNSGRGAGLNFVTLADVDYGGDVTFLGSTRTFLRAYLDGLPGTLAFRMGGGNRRPGGGDDRLDLRGLDIDGALIVAAAAGDDEVRLQYAEIGGDAFVRTGAGNDVVTLRDPDFAPSVLEVGGAENYSGGEGRDRIDARVGAAVRGFEVIRGD